MRSSDADEHFTEIMMIFAIVLLIVCAQAWNPFYSQMNQGLGMYGPQGMNNGMNQFGMNGQPPYGTESMPGGFPGVYTQQPSSPISSFLNLLRPRQNPFNGQMNQGPGMI